MMYESSKAAAALITTALAVIIIAIIVGQLNGCPAPPPTPLDGGAETSAIPQVCKDACANLRKLHCPGERGSPGKDEQYGTKDDVTCDRVCADLEAAAKTAAPYSLHPACIKAAGSCSAVAACAR